MKIEPGFFPGFSPGRYVSSTSPVRHNITRSPTFCVLSTFSNRFFPGFNRVFFRVFKKPGKKKNLVQFSPTPSMADPLWRSPRRGSLFSMGFMFSEGVLRRGFPEGA